MFGVSVHLLRLLARLLYMQDEIPDPRQEHWHDSVAQQCGNAQADGGVDTYAASVTGTDVSVGVAREGETRECVMWVAGRGGG